MLAEGTIAQNAQLHFERIAGEMTCSDCKHAFHPQDIEFVCPMCGSQSVRITKGDEFRVDSIDVE